MTEEDTQEAEAEIEIGTLLAAAFEKEPTAELSDRVVRRVALSATVAELAQMFMGAPVHWLRRDVRPDDEEAATAASDDEDPNDDPEDSR